MLIYETNPELMFEKGAAAICEKLIHGDLSSDPIVWGLCGGRSPVGLFRALLPRLLLLPPALSQRFRFLQVDERLFQEHNQAALAAEIFEPLLNTGRFLSAQFLPFPLPALNESNEIAAKLVHYESLLRSLGSKFHIVVLGSGEDGHIAGVFPGHRSSAERKAGFVAYEESPKPPPGRVTATLPLLARSDLGVLLLLGEEKRQAYRRFADPGVTLEDCPAKIVHQMQDALVLTNLA